jgi:hypothetical protein
MQCKTDWIARLAVRFVDKNRTQDYSPASLKPSSHGGRCSISKFVYASNLAFMLARIVSLSFSFILVMNPSATLPSREPGIL